MTLFLPAEKEGHVKEGGEVGEELEGEHLHGEALLRGSKRSRLLYLRDTSGSGFSGGFDPSFLTMTVGPTEAAARSRHKLEFC